MFMELCIPQPRPLPQPPPPPLQKTTVRSFENPINYAQIHNPPTPQLMLHQDKLKLPLSLRRHFRLLAGITPFHPLCNATRQTLSLISYLTLHHPPPHRLPISGSLLTSSHSPRPPHHPQP